MSLLNRTKNHVEARHPYRTQPRGRALKREGVAWAGSMHERKLDVEAAGRALARRDGVELFIHGRSGTIQDCDSYRNDPHPPNDEKH